MKNSSGFEPRKSVFIHYTVINKKIVDKCAHFKKNLTEIKVLKEK